MAGNIPNIKEKSILKTLRNGRAYTLIELANKSGINRFELSEILTNLMASGWIKERGNRKRHYYFIPTDKINHLETLSIPISKQRDIPCGMKYCRHCYGHLAGYVGVQITEALVNRFYLIPHALKSDSYSTYQVTQKGKDWFADLGISTEQIAQKGGCFTKQCLDFSERKNHLGGKIGDALLDSFLEKGFAEQVPHSREIKITPKGRLFLQTQLDIDLN